MTWNRKDSQRKRTVIHHLWRWVMAQAYSLDLRHRIVGFVGRGGSCREAARHFEVSPSFVVKLISRYRRTGLATPGRRGGSRGKLGRYKEFLIGCLQARPDITMPELAAELEDKKGVKAAPASLSRFLRRIGFRFKKNADGLRARARGCETQKTALDHTPPAAHACPS